MVKKKRKGQPFDVKTLERKRLQKQERQWERRDHAEVIDPDKVPDWQIDLWIKEQRSYQVLGQIEIFGIPNIPILKYQMKIYLGIHHASPKEVIAELRHDYTNYDYLRRGKSHKIVRMLFCEVNRKLCKAVGYDYDYDEKWMGKRKLERMGKNPLLVTNKKNLEFFYGGR